MDGSNEPTNKRIKLHHSPPPSSGDVVGLINTYFQSINHHLGFQNNNSHNNNKSNNNQTNSNGNNVDSVLLEIHDQLRELNNLIKVKFPDPFPVFFMIYSIVYYLLLIKCVLFSRWNKRWRYFQNKHL